MDMAGQRHRYDLPSGKLSIACHGVPLSEHQASSVCPSIKSDQRIFRRVSRQKRNGRRERSVTKKNERKMK
jgi:hypothetical protein